MPESNLSLRQFYEQLLIPASQLLSERFACFRPFVSGRDRVSAGSPQLQAIVGLKSHTSAAKIAAALEGEGHRLLARIHLYVLSQPDAEKRVVLATGLRGLMTCWAADLRQDESGRFQVESAPLRALLNGAARQRAAVRRLDSLMGFPGTDESAWQQSCVQGRYHPLVQGQQAKRWKSLVRNSSFEGLEEALNLNAFTPLTPSRGSAQGQAELELRLASLGRALARNPMSLQATAPRQNEAQLVLQLALNPGTKDMWTGTSSVFALNRFSHTLPEHQRLLLTTVRRVELSGDLVDAEALLGQARALKQDWRREIASLHAGYLSWLAQDRG